MFGRPRRARCSAQRVLARAVHAAPSPLHTSRRTVEHPVKRTSLGCQLGCQRSKRIGRKRQRSSTPASTTGPATGGCLPHAPTGWPHTRTRIRASMPALLLTTPYCCSSAPCCSPASCCMRACVCSPCCAPRRSLALWRLLAPHETLAT
jgi:hypothetical protein